MVSYVKAFSYGVGGIVVTVMAVLVAFQEKLVYVPVLPGLTKSYPITPARLRLVYEDVWLLSSDGVRLHAWFIKRSPDCRGPTILYFQENAGRSEKYITMVSEQFGSLDAKFRNGVYNNLACHESRFDHFNNKLDHIINTLQTLLQSLRIPHNANIQTVTPPPPMLTTTCTTISLLPPKRVQFQPILPPTQILTTTHITPHHTTNDQKIVNKTVQLHVLQVAIRDLDRFLHRNLPTSSHATASVVEKPVIAVHPNTWTTVTLLTPIPDVDQLQSSSENQLMVFPLTVFDPGGNGSVVPNFILVDKDEF